MPKYKKYDPAIKAAIAMTGRIDLFPHLNIPRMTALHWVEHGCDDVGDPTLESIIGAINELKNESTESAQSLAEKESIISLLLETYKILGFQIHWKHIDSTEKKLKILNAAEKAMNAATREACLSTLGLSLSRYKRWRRERRGCGVTGVRSCPRGSVNQLTSKEIQTMRRLVTSNDFSHFPIRLLHYYAKRENLLMCSYSTWRKYIDHYKWKRPRKQMRERKRRIGLRAKNPNEIWHLDVSYFILPDKTKLFIQAIETTSSSKEKNLRLIVDEGGENRSQSVSHLEERGHFRKQVARFEISFSNSMVETLFRSLKHNYLFHREIRSLASLKRHVDFWRKEHNEKIPHSSFKGETPLERFQKTWSKENEIRILVRQQQAVKLRIQENQKIFCESCEVA